VTNLSPALFWYERLGRHICGLPRDAVDGPDLALNAMFDNVNPEKGRLRLGGAGGTLCVVTPEKALLRASIAIPTGLPDHIEIFPQSAKTNNQWLAELWRSPPPSPYLVIEFSKATISSRGFRYSTRDVFHINGKREIAYDLSAIRRGLQACDGVDPKKLFEAGALRRRQLEIPSARAALQLKLDAIAKKIPDLETRLSALPHYGSAEAEAIRIIYYVDQRGQRASDDAA